jgi:hypothetical protein
VKKVPFKNYVYLVIIIAFTVFITISVANLYKNSKRVESEFYKYSNTISNKEFDVYVTEYPDSIIYIYDKYSYKYEDFEEELKNKIEELYLKNNLVYIDKRELNKKFISNMKDNYSLELKYNGKPIIIIISDKEVVSVIEINEESTTDSINLGVFE